VEVAWTSPRVHCERPKHDTNLGMPARRAYRRHVADRVEPNRKLAIDDTESEKADEVGLRSAETISHDMVARINVNITFTQDESMMGDRKAWSASLAVTSST